MKQVGSYETPEGVTIRLVDEGGLPIVRRSDDGLYVAHDLDRQMPEAQVSAVTLYTALHPGGAPLGYLLRIGLVVSLCCLILFLLDRLQVHGKFVRWVPILPLILMPGLKQWWPVEPPLTRKAFERFTAAGGNREELLKGMAYQVARFRLAKRPAAPEAAEAERLFSLLEKRGEIEPGLLDRLTIGMISNRPAPG